jgi:4-hydroxy-2-oxoheptanedioate aldolase
VPVGHMIDEFESRGIAQILDSVGVEFILLDMEHSGFTIADVADQIAWLAATTIAPFVCVPQIEYHLIARCLDVGALGIMVP